MSRLYHYTTAAGLKGIIEGRAIWASDYRFLNDSQEFRYGMLMFKRVLDSRAKELRPCLDGIVYESVNDIAESLIDSDRDILDSVSISICSFSEAADLLSQWRGYNGGKGYSLGMNAEWLQSSSAKSGYTLAPVHYDEGAQALALWAKIQELIVSTKNATQEEFSERLQFWFQSLFQTIAYCKHPAFLEEKEHRAVRITNGWPNDIKTRPGPAGLIPYSNIPLDGDRPSNYINHENNKGFEHIIIGPAFHERQKRAVDAMLAPLQMRFAVTHSAVPFVAD